jgi:hypothetical protein
VTLSSRRRGRGWGRLLTVAVSEEGGVIVVGVASWYIVVVEEASQMKRGWESHVVVDRREREREGLHGHRVRVTSSRGRCAVHHRGNKGGGETGE